MTKLIVAFCNFANVPKKGKYSVVMPTSSSNNTASGEIACPAASKLKSQVRRTPTDVAVRRTEQKVQIQRIKKEMKFNLIKKNKN
jgi:hypothetical protein